jgi:hypothetical protein
VEDVIRALYREARFIEEPAEKNALLSFATATGNGPRLRETISRAARIDGMWRNAALMDFDPNLLPVRNGTDWPTRTSPPRAPQGGSSTTARAASFLAGIRIIWTLRCCAGRGNRITQRLIGIR